MENKKGFDYNNIGIEKIVEKAEKEAKKFKDDQVKTNQIRNFYSSIAKMRTDYAQGVAKIKSENKLKIGSDEYEKACYGTIRTELIMLKPKLAYAAGRQRAVRRSFYPFMTKAIDGVANAECKTDAIEKFFALIESVVAYHKFFGDS